MVEKSPTGVVIDCGGVGYQIHISLHTFSTLPQTENVKLYTHLLVKEDAHTLYGFVEQFEREIFRLLISVSGVGAGTARTMLSSLTPNQIKEAIALNDVATIQSIKGIGAKTAQRVILDLKDKIIKVYALDDVLSQSSNTNKDEALSALETLGFLRKQAEKACDKVLRENPEATVETIIKLALKNL
ncbi:Holliday junction ATP-dependent DNA helicase RuvA [Planktosalinus lacus]|uniref:Holliday junction branch migration complex subunit RuvA n=2 Tax=Planktosalinus lacus TaxID=1526573 RepID=A0A8J2V880_9FLAO|nr:Holliday junction ATP-dependent DNA helicase RuvA [Planktosalinus lacus]